MNSAADDLPLLLGLLDAGEQREEALLRLHVDERHVEVLAEVSTTCSASSLRSRPWSTNTHVSWSPTALWTSSAATAESTPPESAQRMRSEPTWARIRSTCSSITAAGVHAGGASATS